MALVLTPEEIKGKLVRCKLCGEVHPLRLDKKKKPYISCDNWGTLYWLRRDPAVRWLLESTMEAVKTPSPVIQTIEKETGASRETDSRTIPKEGVTLWKQKRKWGVKI